MKFFKKRIVIISASLLMMSLFAAPLAAEANGGNPPPPGPATPPPPGPPRPLPPSPKDPDNMLYYRGSRTAQEELPLEINQIKVKRTGASMVDIEIVFNRSINPRTVKHHYITIDGIELPQVVRFWFNKKGDTVKFVLPSEKDSFEMGIKRIRAFDGTVMSPAVMTVEVSAAEEDFSNKAE